LEGVSPLDERSSLAINLHLQEKLDENNLGPKKIDRMLFDKKITGEILQLPVYFTEYLFKLLPRD